MRESEKIFKIDHKDECRKRNKEIRGKFNLFMYRICVQFWSVYHYV